MDYTIANLENEYEMELERVVDEIRKSGAKSVLLQLPDGLKPWAVCVVDYLQEKLSSVDFKIWLGIRN